MLKVVVNVCKELTEDVVRNISDHYKMDPAVMKARYCKLSHTLLDVVDDAIVVYDPALNIKPP